MGLLNKINVVSGSSGALSSATDYPLGVTLPAGAKVVHIYIEEDTNCTTSASGTLQVQAAGASGDVALTATIAAASVADGEVAVTNGFSIVEASPLQVTVGTGAFDAGAVTVYVAYINGPDV
tara:strand:- start:9863 stop:10228 length:366 start_codon:yes stop_codon:yes gene_type:complete